MWKSRRTCSTSSNARDPMSSTISVAAFLLLFASASAAPKVPDSLHDAPEGRDRSPGRREGFRL